MAKMTQRQMVLKHLQEFGSLDPFTAFKEYGIFTNLRTRVCELRKQGYKIKTEWIHGKSKITGRTWSMAKYILETEQ